MEEKMENEMETRGSIGLVLDWKQVSIASKLWEGERGQNCQICGQECKGMHLSHAGTKEEEHLSASPLLRNL